MQVLIAGPRLEFCPELREIDVARRSVGRHSHIRLRGDRGEVAERLLREAAEEFGGSVDVEQLADVEREPGE